jgi:hypothetical protein
MKVLKRPDTNWSMKHTCVKCTAELEIEKTDVSYKYCDGDRNESGYDSYSSSCPLCQTIILIENRNIPQAVQVEIQKGKPLYSAR